MGLKASRPQPGRLSQGTDRRQHPLLSHPTYLRDVEGPAKNCLAEALERGGERLVPARISGRRIKYDVVENKARVVPCQPLKKRHVQSPIPNVIERLL